MKACLCALALVFTIGQPWIVAAEDPAPESEVWATLESSDFIRTWLLCGVFPNPPDETAPGRSAIGLHTDYLTDHGGEGTIGPIADMVHRRPNGTEATWFTYTSPTDGVDFTKAFANQPKEEVVAYAYATLQIETAGKAVLGLGSDDGVRVWLNGELVHDLLVGRGLTKDEDRVEVELLEGENRFLIKVENGVGGWGLSARLISGEEARLLAERDARRRRLMQFQDAELRPRGLWDYMITPGGFPDIVWDQPGVVESAVGEFSYETRWFDPDLQEVEKPDRPGRYIAYAEGELPSGTPFRRSITVFCRPPEWQPWNDRIKAYVDYPPRSPIDEGAWNEHREVIAERMGGQFVWFLETEEPGAILMSYLHEMEPLGREPSPTETPEVAHGDQNLRLKLRVLGLEGRYPPLELPRKTDEQATVLHAGSPAQAGVADDAAERIRAVCQKWYEDSEQPFVTLVARRGVIVLHEAFGPVPLDASLEMASITKAISGMMFAQFLDQDRIDLDDPIGEVLPGFPTEGEMAITSRHLFTHTTGLDGHWRWGGIHNVWLENIVLNGLDYLEPGKVRKYNGTGYDLSAKVMEVLGGKTIVRLMHENFFGPLGLEDTTIDNMATSARCTARDTAILGQLLLNRGAYGDRVFFSPETFEELVPRPLEEFYPDVGEDWGIGLAWMRESHPDAGTGDIPGDATLLSANTIGHGSATSAILRVDLDNEIVVAQVRSTAGPKYREFFVQFLQAIHESIM